MEIYHYLQYYYIKDKIEYILFYKNLYELF